MNAKELAELVLKWAKTNDEITKYGLGGGMYERWDNARYAMISAAV